jgi:hypothetical protein
VLIRQGVDCRADLSSEGPGQDQEGRMPPYSRLFLVRSHCPGTLLLRSRLAGGEARDPSDTCLGHVLIPLYLSQVGRIKQYALYC